MPSPPKNHRPPRQRVRRSSTRKQVRPVGRPPRPAHHPWIGVILTALVLLAVVYYFTAARSDDESLSGSSETAGIQLLKEVAAAYQNVNNYRDRTLIEVHAPNGPDSIANRIVETARIRLAYSRPNKIRLVADRPQSGVEIQLASDGNQLRAKVTDAATDDFDHQFVERSAPRRLELGTLYSGTEYAELDQPNELFSLLMALPVQLRLSQIGLLLANGDDRPLESLVRDSSTIERLSDAPLAGFACHRVSASSNDGSIVLWIDASTSLLRRIEFPWLTLPSDRPGKIVVTYRNISTNPDIPSSDFQLEPVAEAQLVRHFVLPPNSEVPPALNQQIEPFSLTSLQGEPIESRSWEDKIAVLLWFDRQQASQAALAQMQPVFEKYSNRGDVDFLAICTEPSTVMSHADVGRLLDQWNCTLPASRDLDAVGQSNFHIAAVPCLVIVNQSGVVQLVEHASSSELDKELPVVIDELVEGKPLAEAYLQFLKKRTADYQRHLAAASVGPPKSIDALPTTTIAVESKPSKLSLSEQWRFDEFDGLGNTIVLRNGERLTTMVSMNGDQLAQLDARGKLVNANVLGDHSSPLHQWQSARDGTGRRVVLGWSNLAKSAVVFDANWQPTISYPPQDQRLPSIQTAHLADLDEDGRLELYVAFAKDEGIHCVDDQGRVQWAQSDLAGIVSLTSSVDESGTPFLMTATDRGEIVPVDADGQRQQPISIGRRAIHHLYCSDEESPTGVFCGISLLGNDRKLAVGLNGRLKESWSYALPPGVSPHQIQNVAHVRWNRQIHWILAAADGSIHVISDDGNFHDHWNSGLDLTGLSVHRGNESPLLYLSTRHAVRAIQMSTADVR